MKTKIIIFIIVFCCCIFTNLYSQGLQTDRSISGKVIAQGETFVGEASDISAIRYNPAGLAQLTGQSFIVNHQKDFGGIVGGNFTYFSIGTSIGEGRYLALGANMYKIPEEEIGYSYAENLMTISYASGERDRGIFYGLNLKYITTSWNNILTSSGTTTLTTQGYSLDAGLLYRFSNRLQFGISVEDLISAISSSEGGEDDVLETKLSVGSCFRINNTTKLLLDIKNPIDFNNAIPKRKKTDPDYYPLSINIGFEKYIDENIALRCGYVSSDKKFTAGVGIGIGPWNIDYAYSPTKAGGVEIVGIPKDEAHKLSVIMKLR